jgi:hypothetical protein
MYIYLENREKISESEFVLCVIHRVEINSTLINLRVCLSLARFPIDIFFLANVMATLKCSYISIERKLF